MKLVAEMERGMDSLPAVPWKLRQMVFSLGASDTSSRK